ncbi:hypothetical protein RKD19_004732 [Streptomyces canus]
MPEQAERPVEVEGSVFPQGADGGPDGEDLCEAAASKSVSVRIGSSGSSVSRTPVASPTAPKAQAERAEAG